MSAPTTTSARIETLDVLRGFALLGILLMNIWGFGLPAAAYNNPLTAGGGDVALNLATWSGAMLFFEGAMRCLFSILFGAGVLLFLGPSDGARTGLHYKRNFWLLMFGLFDMFVLLWVGDILIVYALAGFLLFAFRNGSARSLLIGSTVLVLAMSAWYGLSNVGLSFAQDAWEQVQVNPEQIGPDEAELADAWASFQSDMHPSDEVVAAELDARRDSYATAAAWAWAEGLETLLFVVPVYVFWDALAMMLLGMALYRMNILDGSRPLPFYRNLALGGFALGLSVNAYEYFHAVANNYDLLSVFPFMQWSYHFGRIGMALGYLAVVIMICKLGWLAGLRRALAAVGRLALTNYLMQSLICLFLFTGAGLALVGKLELWQLYIVVAAIWGIQLAFSPWWSRRFRYGPLEWIWRMLTYGRIIPNRSEGKG